MDCALWLNRKKVFDADEIPENADIAALRGYFLAESLIPWLKEHNGESYARELEKLPRDAPDLNERLSAIFGGDAGRIPAKELSSATAPDAFGANVGSFAGSVYVPTSLELAVSGITSNLVSSYEVFGFGVSSYEISSYSASGYELTSFLAGYAGSYNISSDTAWTYAASGGSFFATSGRYWFWEWEWEFYRALSGGSFTTTSFGSGGFGMGWEWLARLLAGYGSFSFGAWGSFSGSFPAVLGSFAFSPELLLENLPLLDEYDRILLETLAFCPLDRYGYGIHII